MVFAIRGLPLTCSPRVGGKVKSAISGGLNIASTEVSWSGNSIFGSTSGTSPSPCVLVTALEGKGTRGNCPRGPSNLDRSRSLEIPGVTGGLTGDSDPVALESVFLETCIAKFGDEGCARVELPTSGESSALDVALCPWPGVSVSSSGISRF